MNCTSTSTNNDHTTALLSIKVSGNSRLSDEIVILFGEFGIGSDVYLSTVYVSFERMDCVYSRSILNVSCANVEAGTMPT
jgi:hypothetical protein